MPTDGKSMGNVPRYLHNSAILNIYSVPSQLKVFLEGYQRSEKSREVATVLTSWTHSLQCDGLPWYLLALSGLRER